MAVKSRAVSVTTAATRLDTVDTAAVNEAAQSVAFYNAGSVTVYIGGSAVTTAAGTPVAASSWSPGIELAPGDGLFGIVASGTSECRVLEVGV